MTTLERKLRAGLRQLGVERRDPQATILVAVSGGADSTALLDALVRWRTDKGLPHPAGTLSLAHLNHLLRGEESDEDEQFVRAMAAKFGLKVTIAREAVPAHATGQNLEATARRLRYEFLERAARQCGALYVATAHTQDDQVETVLMRLLRGSGAAGLRGIRAQTRLASGVSLIRPLLTVTRIEVLAHCAQYELTFRNDSSNESRELMRNRVRHELLPMLKTFNPRVGEALLRTAAQAVEDDDLLRAHAAEFMAAQADGQTLQLRPFRELHPAVRRRVLRLWLEAARGDLRRIEAAHLMAAESLALNGEGGSYVELPGGSRVRRERGQLRFVPPTA
jgi:tRNA(Ile)-lysidine synthase